MPNLDPIVADPNQLEQVLTQLCAAAREAMPSGGAVELSTRQERLDAAAAAAALGAPRPACTSCSRRATPAAAWTPATLERIFEPFFSTQVRQRRRGLRPRAPSTASSSRAAATSTSPASPAAAHVHAVLPPARGQRPDRRGRGPREPAGGTETILLVEDEEQVRDLARRVLERVGYTVLTASDAESATAIADRRGGPHPSAGHRHAAAAAQRPGAGRAAQHPPARRSRCSTSPAPAIPRSPGSACWSRGSPSSRSRSRSTVSFGRSGRRSTTPTKAADRREPAVVVPQRRDESRDAFRALFQRNPLPMWIYDSETLGFLEVNDAAVHTYGYSRSEFLRMSILDIRPTEDRARSRTGRPPLRRPPGVGDAVAAPPEGRVGLPRPGVEPSARVRRAARAAGHGAGRHRDHQHRGGAAGEPRALSLLHRPNRRRRVAGRGASRPSRWTLPEEEQVARCIRHVRLVEVNDAMFRMYGCHRGQASSSAPSSRARSTWPTPGALEFFRAFVRSGYRTVELESYEFDRLGAPHWFVNNLLGVVEDGRLTAIWGTQRDVTERRHQEEMVRAARDHVTAMVEASPLPIVGVAPDGVVMTWNRAAETVFGWTAEEAVGQRLMCVPPEQAGRVRRVPQPRAAGKLVHRARDRADPEGRHQDRREHLDGRAARRRRPRHRAGRDLSSTSADGSGRRRRSGTRRSSSGRRRRWKPWAGWPAASPTTSTTC